MNFRHIVVPLLLLLVSRLEAHSLPRVCLPLGLTPQMFDPPMGLDNHVAPNRAEPPGFLILPPVFWPLPGPPAFPPTPHSTPTRSKQQACQTPPPCLLGLSKSPLRPPGCAMDVKISRVDPFGALAASTPQFPTHKWIVQARCELSAFPLERPLPSGPGGTSMVLTRLL